MQKYLITLIVLLLVFGVYFMTRANRNVRNNNPLNIRESANWEGERLLDLDKAFEEYKTPEHGFRAAYIILLQYLERGIDTVEKVVSKWAPESDNNHTSEYIKYVSQNTGLNEFQQLSPGDLARIMLVMSEFEGGNGHFTAQQVTRGIELAQQEDFVVARLYRINAGMYS